MVMIRKERARWLGSAALAIALSWGGTATAEEQVPESFLAHLGVGTGFSRYYEKAKAPHTTETKIRSRSLTSSLDLYLGGAPIPGLAVGVGILGRTMIDPSIKVNGVLVESTSSTLGLAALSLFGQWYPGWVPPQYGQLYLRAQVGYAQSYVQFQHDALVGENQYGPMLGGAVGFSFFEIKGFRFGAEGQVMGSWMTARQAGAHVETSWYAGTYGLTVSYF